MMGKWLLIDNWWWLMMVNDAYGYDDWMVMFYIWSNNIVSYTVSMAHESVTGQLQNPVMGSNSCLAKLDRQSQLPPLLTELQVGHREPAHQCLETRIFDGNWFLIWGCKQFLRDLQMNILIHVWCMSDACWPFVPYRTIIPMAGFVDPVELPPGYRWTVDQQLNPVGWLLTVDQQLTLVD